MLVLLALVYGAPCSSAQETGPSLELLEFLGAWQDDDGSLIDFEMLEPEEHALPIDHEPEDPGDGE